MHYKLNQLNGFFLQMNNKFSHAYATNLHITVNQDLH